VTSDSAPPEVVEPVCKTLEAAKVKVCLVDVGRAGARRKAIGRVIRSVVGEVAERRLLRGLLNEPPEVTFAFDPASAAALCAARDERKSFAPVIAVIPELNPRAAWGDTDADRYLTLDDSAAVALSDLGVDGKRVLAIGPIAGRRFAEMTKSSRTQLRKQFNLETRQVFLAEVDGFGYETSQQIALQLAIIGRSATTLFDAGDDSEAATALRRQVPTLDMRAKLFGRTEDAPALWRSANIVIARPTLRAVSRALLLGARFVSLCPEGDAQEQLAKAIEERGIASTAKSVLLLSSAVEQVLRATGNIKAYAGRNGARIVADIARVVGHQRVEVLSETRAADEARSEQEAEQARAAAFEADAVAAAEARVTSAPGGLEDLSGAHDGGGGAGSDGGGGVELSDVVSMRAELSTRIDRTKKRIWEARKAAENWDKKWQEADATDRDDLAQQARRAADAERARMHGALQDLARLEQEGKRLEQLAVEAASRGAARSRSQTRKSTARASAPADDLLEQMKSKTRRKSKSIDDELAALKRKMKGK